MLKIAPSPRTILPGCILFCLILLAGCNGTIGTPTSTPSVAPAPAATPSIVNDLWRPEVGVTWQWQLTDAPVDTSIDADVYDVDLFETDAATVRRLHDLGRRVICYVNAGGWEDWRGDADAFPAEVIGGALDGWPGERWLDITRLDVLAPIMEARLNKCSEKGFDGVEPDNVDAFDNPTGFQLTYEDQIAYNLWWVEQAHARGLSIGLKNALQHIPDVVDEYDWALNEECFAYKECEELSPFINAGKAVFHVEYEVEAAEFCPQTTALGFSSMRKGWDLDATFERCG